MKDNKRLERKPTKPKLLPVLSLTPFPSRNKWCYIRLIIAIYPDAR
jgi:hypothetical protein